MPVDPTDSIDRHPLQDIRRMSGDEQLVGQVEALIDNATLCVRKEKRFGFLQSKDPSAAAAHD